MYKNRLLTLIAAAALAAAGCSESEVLSQTTEAVGTELPVSAVTLLVETPQELDLIFEEQSSIIAKVVFTDSGAAAPQLPVSFAIVGSAGGASLETGMVMTDRDGRAANVLTTGLNRVAFEVAVSTVQNDGSTLTEYVEIRVDGTYKGTLEVDFAYSDIVPLSTVTAQLHEGSSNCDTINYASLPAVFDSRDTTDVESTVVFDRLNEGAVYTVTALAVGPAGNIVAEGCIVADAILGRAAVEATVPMKLRAVEFEGDYDFSTQLHLNEALPPPADLIISEIEHFFVDPVDLLIYYIAYGLEGYTGLTPEEFATYLDMAALLGGYGSIEQAVYDNVLDRMPGWANDGMNIGGDVTGLLNHLTVGGTMRFANVSDEGALQGEWGWDDFLFQWRYDTDCDFTNTCCGRQTFSGEEMGIEPVDADFTGSIMPREVAEGSVPTALDYDLTIDEHRLGLRYGNLIVFTLNQFVFPAITGQDNLACAAESLFGCEDGGEFVCGGQNVGVCGCDRVGAWVSDTLSGLTSLDPSTAAQACDFGLQALEALFVDRLNGLEYEGGDTNYMTMAVDGSISDSDMNLKADLLSGEGVGYVSQPFPNPANDWEIEVVTTDFTADVYGDMKRVSCSANSDCGSNETCQVRAQVLDECNGRQVCAVEVGALDVGAACVRDNQCGSGVCMDNNTCFGACESDEQCGDALNCAEAFTAVTIGDTASLVVNACVE
jgi:hypothetical protein